LTLRFDDWGAVPPELLAFGAPVLLLLVFVGGLWLVSWRFNSGDTGPPKLVGRSLTQPPPIDYGPLLQRDRGFSEPLLLDLAQLVFTTAHSHRPHNLEGLRPYVTDGVRRELAGRPGPVEGVAPGTCRVVALDITDRARITVEHLATWRHQLPGEAPVRIRALERWTWERSLDATSPAPAAMQALRCPACGNADAPAADGRCASCDTPRCDGSTQWICTAVQSELRRALVEELVLGTKRDIGRDLPTVRQPGVLRNLELLPNVLPDFTWSSFQADAAAAFEQTHRGWATEARHHHSDRYHQVQRFLMADLRERGLKPVHDKVRVERVEPAKVVADQYYVAVTVRIFASLVEYLVNSAGHLVSGDQHQQVQTSEYWTFLKARPGSAGAAHCPGCGAAVETTGGACGFCGGQLSGAPSGWLVSATVDDDLYAG